MSAVETREIVFRVHGLGEPYALPKDACEGDVYTKLRYFKPGAEGERRIKMTAVVEGLPSDEEIRSARVAAILDGGGDVEMVVLRMGWTPIHEIDNVSGWSPARDFPDVRKRDNLAAFVSWDELDRRKR